MFVIDFDDTLFDTQRFKDERFTAMQALGVTAEEYWDTYYQARNDADGFFTYNDSRHADFLGEIGYDQDQVLDALSSTTSRLKDFLPEDTFSFLDAVKEISNQTGAPMILLSLGDPMFQEIKTKGTGVHEYFDRTFMVDEKKHEILAELFESFAENETWFINDKVRETIDLMHSFPAMKPVLKKSPKIDIREYTDSGFPFFNTLAEIQAYVTK